MPPTTLMAVARVVLPAGTVLGEYAGEAETAAASRAYFDSELGPAQTAGQPGDSQGDWEYSEAVMAAAAGGELAGRGRLRASWVRNELAFINDYRTEDLTTAEQVPRVPCPQPMQRSCIVRSAERSLPPGSRR
jgi:hypothetical protein